MMGWAAEFFGAGGAVLVVGCLVGMGLLMWLLFRLTSDSSARVSIPAPRQAQDRALSEGLTDADAAADADVRERLRIGEQPSSGPAGSGSVAP